MRVSAGLAPWALGSDTGGSIKQPAALCGNVGLRPTYGTVSRFGVVAFACSLEQVGPMALTVRDAAVADIVPKMSDLQDYGEFNNPRMIYNLGHAVFEFMESKWGKEGLRQYLFALRKSVIGGGDKAAFMALTHEMNVVVHDIAAELGGSISAEHGVGRLKRDELLHFKSTLELQLMKKIKKAMDPLDIMNPGKVISPLIKD